MMDMITLYGEFTAEEARQVVEAGERHSFTQQVMKVLAMILTEASKGQSRLILSDAEFDAPEGGEFDPDDDEFWAMLEEELVERGFTVQNDDYFIVSW